jgi:hypothetical protein
MKFFDLREIGNEKVENVGEVATIFTNLQVQCTKRQSAGGYGEQGRVAAALEISTLS